MARGDGENRQSDRVYLSGGKGKERTRFSRERGKYRVEKVQTGRGVG